MWAPRSIALAALLAVTLVCSPRASSAGDTGYQVIVHPDNDVSSVSADFLRRAYLKKIARWGSGETLRPIDLKARAGARDKFTREVIKKTPAQLRAYWNAQIFSGKGVPPPEARSTAAAIAYVLANAGAVAYIPADADPGGCKVVRVE